MSRRRYFEEQRSGNGAIYHCVKTEIEPGDKIRLFNLMNKVKSDTISQVWIRFDPYPASEQQGIIYKFQINDQRYVFMFSNRYDGMRDLINNADENVDCITSATESSIYHNDSFYIFV